MLYLIVILGLIFGSFLNVLIFRLPNNLSFIYPPSHCLKCKKPIMWRHNIPILSYFFLKGNSYCCNKPISIQYPVVELTSALLWLWSYYFIPDISNKVLFLVLSSLLLVIFFTDLYYFIIPLEINVIMFISILLHKIYNSKIILGDFFSMLSISFLFLFFVFLVSFLIKKNAMGYGDIILIGVISFWLSWTDILIIIFFSCIISLIHWMVIYLKTRKSNIRLPFGSSLSLVTIIYYMIIITCNINIFFNI